MLQLSMFEGLDDPVNLMLVIMLSLASTIFMGKGFKEKSVSNLLMGIGTGVPTMAATDWRFWLAGAAMTYGGWWLKREYEL